MNITINVGYKPLIQIALVHEYCDMVPLVMTFTQYLIRQKRRAEGITTVPLLNSMNL